MAVPAIGDLLLITMRGTIFSQRVMNTFWYSVKSLNLVNTPTVETLSNQIFTAMGPGSGFFTTYLDVLPSNYTVNEMWVQKIFPTRIMKEVLDVTLTGTEGHAANTANVQASIMRRTEVAAPGNIGGIRICVPDVPACVVAGMVHADYKAKLNGLAANMDLMLTVAVGTTIEPVLPTRDPPVAPKKQGIINGSRDVDRIEVFDTVRTLARRTVGRGE